MRDHDGDSASRLAYPQLDISLEKHEQMLRSARRWQKVSTPTDIAPTPMPRLRLLLTTILHFVTK